MIQSYIRENAAAQLQLLRELGPIPAPSHHEEKRAEFCLNWFKENGCEGAYIDEALNVIWPLNCEGSKEITVVVAHTDTVFPDTEPLPLVEDDECLRCPGIGDDTANLVNLMYAARFFAQNGLKPKKGVLFVCNSCEEGLGNLKGTRAIMKAYEGRVKQFLSLDGSSHHRVADRCVGSHRYQVEVRTQGGHSFSAFGNKNALAALSELICGIYAIEIPKKEGAKTTYNVGIVKGGTSVNTIAQSASMLCEYRSDNVECLAYMEQKFRELFENARTDEVTVLVDKIGDRPCADIDPEVQEQLAKRLCDTMYAVTGIPTERRSSSTDCNIPLSMGIPAVCIGTVIGGGAHTREEYIEKASMPRGMEIAIRTIMEITEVTL